MSLTRTFRRPLALSDAVRSAQARAYKILEPEAGEHWLQRPVTITIATLIVLNVAAVILESMPSLARYAVFFEAFEAISVAIFSVEYGLRLWSCTSDEHFRGTLTGRLRFALRPMALIDLLAIAPAFVPGEAFLDLRFIRAVRLIRALRVLKVARYSRTIKTFANVAKAKKDDLALTALLLLLLLVLSSSAMYYAEHEAQPKVFTSIPAAAWWATVTLTTVGYGDIYPVTPVGKFLGSIIALIGIGFFALPAGLLAAGFADELQKRRKKATCPHCGRDLDSR